jgi:hypothetical protein
VDEQDDEEEGGGGGFGDMHSKGSPAGAAKAQALKQALVAFYRKHNPAKVKDVDHIMANFKVEETAKGLKKVYGELPQGWGTGAEADRGAASRKGKESTTPRVCRGGADVNMAVAVDRGGVEEIEDSLYCVCPFGHSCGDEACMRHIGKYGNRPHAEW